MLEILVKKQSLNNYIAKFKSLKTYKKSPHYRKNPTQNKNLTCNSWNPSLNMDSTVSFILQSSSKKVQPNVEIFEPRRQPFLLLSSGQPFEWVNAGNHFSLCIKNRAAEWNSQETREKKRWNECSALERESIWKTDLIQIYYYKYSSNNTKTLACIPRISSPTRWQA